MARFDGLYHSCHPSPWLKHILVLLVFSFCHLSLAQFRPVDTTLPVQVQQGQPIVQTSSMGPVQIQPAPQPPFQPVAAAPPQFQPLAAAPPQFQPLAAAAAPPFQPAAAALAQPQQPVQTVQPVQPIYVQLPPQHVPAYAPQGLVHVGGPGYGAGYARAVAQFAEQDDGLLPPPPAYVSRRVRTVFPDEELTPLDPAPQDPVPEPPAKPGIDLQKIGSLISTAADLASTVLDKTGSHGEGGGPGGLGGILGMASKLFSFL